jgi:hypothetical protein
VSCRSTSSRTGLQEGAGAHTHTLSTSGPLDRLSRRGAATPAVRHVVGNFIVSEDIKSPGRHRLSHRGPPVADSGSPAARQRALAAIKVSSVGTSIVARSGGHHRVGHCVGAPPEDAGGLSDRAECNPKIADMVKLLEGLAAPISHGKVRVASNRNRLNRTKRAIFSWRRSVRLTGSTCLIRRFHTR